MWKAILSVIGAVVPAIIPLLKKKVTAPHKHIFFNEITRYKKHILPGVKLYHKWKYDKWRSQIFKDMICIKFDIWETYLEKSIAKKNHWAWEMIDVINWIVDWYNKKWREYWIPEIVIDKFNERHHWHANMLFLSIENIVRWWAFSSDREKVNAALYMHLAMAVQTFNDAEKTLGKLNWELSWVIYKWIELL